MDLNIKIRKFDIVDEETGEIYAMDLRYREAVAWVTSNPRFVLRHVDHTACAVYVFEKLW